MRQEEQGRAEKQRKHLLLYQAPYWIGSGGEVDGEESPLLLHCFRRYIDAV